MHASDGTSSKGTRAARNATQPTTRGYNITGLLEEIERLRAQLAAPQSGAATAIALELRNPIPSANDDDDLIDYEEDEERL
jgi:hypothetical protein